MLVENPSQQIFQKIKVWVFCSLKIFIYFLNSKKAIKPWDGTQLFKISPLVRNPKVSSSMEPCHAI